MKFKKLATAILVFYISGCGGSGGGGPGSVPKPPEPPPPPPEPPPPPPPVECLHTLTWVNPTLDEDGQPLEVDELVAGTIYVFSIPMAAPEEAELQIGVDPYSLLHERIVPAGMWYYRMTVSNLDADGNEQASAHSNEVSKECS